MILGIETSCDDTCAAVVGGDGTIHSNVVASQGLLHARYGGVVPEIASRRHLELLDAVVSDALERAGVTLDDVRTVAVTRGPGLIGALLVGVSAAKALAAARRLPLAPIDHLAGHVLASTLGPGEFHAEAFVATPEEVAERAAAAGPNALAAGDGSLRFRGLLEAAGVTVADDGSGAHVVRALNVCRLAARVRPVAAEAVVPNYLRAPDARPQT